MFFIAYLYLLRGKERKPELLFLFCLVGESTVFVTVALGDGFHSLVLGKPDLKEIWKSNQQFLACFTGQERSLLAFPWLGGTLQDPAPVPVPSPQLHLAQILPTHSPLRQPWWLKMHRPLSPFFSTCIGSVSLENRTSLSPGSNKTILIHSWWYPVDSFCLLVLKILS